MILSSLKLDFLKLESGLTLLLPLVNRKRHIPKPSSGKDVLIHMKGLKNNIHFSIDCPLPYSKFKKKERMQGYKIRTNLTKCTYN